MVKEGNIICTDYVYMYKVIFKKNQQIVIEDKTK